MLPSKERSPLAGQWQCATCSRTFGRHFTQCAYCPFAGANQQVILDGSHQNTLQAPKPAAQVGRPTRGVTGRVWAILDSLGSTATLSALLAKVAVENINASTARTQFSKWKKVSRSP